MNIHFSDFFNIPPEKLDSHGALDVSLLNDLPLFIDPFLIFNSERQEYGKLHKQIVRYFAFLRDRSREGTLDDGLRREWYCFPEVRQNWLGYCVTGNRGHGLGMGFARSVAPVVGTLFADEGVQASTTKGDHIEKLGLIREGVGRDSISDLSTNLIKDFLCRFTERLAANELATDQVREFAVAKAVFNYETRTWSSKTYKLPCYRGDFVLLTPMDLLTKDEIWINRQGMQGSFDHIVSSLPNEQIRSKVRQYLKSKLTPNSKNPEIKRVRAEAFTIFPELVDQYIALRERQGAQATSTSKEKVELVRTVFVEQLRKLVENHLTPSKFFEPQEDIASTRAHRLAVLRKVFSEPAALDLLCLQRRPPQSESELQMLMHMLWSARIGDSNVAFADESWETINFKLASNSKLAAGLSKLLAETDKAVVVFSFNASQHDSFLATRRSIGGAAGGRMIGLGWADETVAAGGSQVKDFFVSYTGADSEWAIWIAQELEREGFTTLIQAWDFAAGSGFIEHMHRGIQQCGRMIAVLSPMYLKSSMAAAEWQAVLAEDPLGTKGKLIPVRVKEVDPPGLLKQRVYIDIVGLDAERARSAMLNQLIPGRGRQVAKMGGHPFPGSE